MAWDLESGLRIVHFFFMTELATLRVRILIIGTLPSVLSIPSENNMIPLVCVVSSVGSSTCSVGSAASDISSSSDEETSSWTGVRLGFE